MSEKIDIIRELTTAQQKAQIIREQVWKAFSVGASPDAEYINNLAVQIDDILFYTIYNLKKKEQDNAER